jgi:hypothetical protein
MQICDETCPKVAKNYYNSEIQQNKDVGRRVDTYATNGSEAAAMAVIGS